MNLPNNSHPASYRDPSGFIYKHDGTYYRFVNKCYQKHYDHAHETGLYQQALKKNMMLDFKEISLQHIDSKDFYKTLLPEQIPFDSFPWEWNFDQLRDAAITTLELCRIALEKNMILKDATPLNLRFVNGKMKLIDHLSFEVYKEGNTWIAYRQFCECFLNPLLVASYRGMEVHRIMLAYPGGLSAEITSGLLPLKSRFNLHIQLHVFLQSRIQRKEPGNTGANKPFNKEKISRIVDSLLSCIKNLPIPSGVIQWSNYYDATILSKEYLTHKKSIIGSLLSELSYSSVLDAGCNDGSMALLCRKDAEVVAADNDSTCINELYHFIRKQKIKNIYPAVIDLTFPTGGMGWNNNEYLPFFNRKEFDLILALALIHHLCIGKNIPLNKVAAFFAGCGRQLIIEFVPREDPKVKSMLSNREDIFEAYTPHNFETAFGEYFTILQKIQIDHCDRIIYKMVRK